MNTTKIPAPVLGLTDMTKLNKLSLQMAREQQCQFQSMLGAIRQRNQALPTGTPRRLYATMMQRQLRELLTLTQAYRDGTFEIIMEVQAAANNCLSMPWEAREAGLRMLHEIEKEAQLNLQEEIKLCLAIETLRDELLTA
ncbi:hypothetical protein LUCX_102 [Xanthomonas phage vB_XciM_LucasX]|nr:hypothetical protein LUCX_102 [Xanthomonas phage vB_XciM_LucasX]